MDPREVTASEELFRGLGLLGPALRDLTQRLGDLSGKVDGLSSALDAKAERADVASLAQLGELRSEVHALGSSLEASLEARCERGEQAPTLEQLKALEQALDLKVAGAQSLARADVEEVHQALAEALARLHALSLPCAEELGALRSLAREWPDLKAQVEASLASRGPAQGERSQAGEGEPPSAKAFEVLRRAVAKKADISEVPSLREFEMLSSSLRGKAEALEEAMAGKADASEVPTLDVLEVLSNTVTQQLEVLGNSFAGKFRAMDATLSNKAEAKQAATREQVEALAAALDAKAEQEWAQEQIKGITSILLPVARTVRETMRSPGPLPGR